MIRLSLLSLLIGLGSFAQSEVSEISTPTPDVAESATDAASDAETASAAKPPAAESAKPQKGAGKNVVVVPLRDVIDDTLLYVLRRGFDKVLDQEADVMVIDMHTPGGSLATTEEIIARIREIRNGGTKVYSFVNTDAISAGAITSLACDGIYMAPSARIGGHS